MESKKKLFVQLRMKPNANVSLGDQTWENDLKHSLNEPSLNQLSTQNNVDINAVNE